MALSGLSSRQSFPEGIMTSPLRYMAATMKFFLKFISLNGFPRFLFRIYYKFQRLSSAVDNTVESLEIVVFQRVVESPDGIYYLSGRDVLGTDGAVYSEEISISPP